MKRKLYVLTDGTNLHGSEYMNDDELETAQEKAKTETDGNLEWREVKTPVPNVANIL